MTPTFIFASYREASYKRSWVSSQLADDESYAIETPSLRICLSSAIKNGFNNTFQYEAQLCPSDTKKLVKLLFFCHHICTWNKGCRVLLLQSVEKISCSPRPQSSYLYKKNLVLFCCGRPGLSENSRRKKWKINFYQNVKEKKITGPICYVSFLFLWVKQKKEKAAEGVKQRVATNLLNMDTDQGNMKDLQLFHWHQPSNQKCLLSKYRAWHYWGLGMNLSSIHALLFCLFCLRRTPGQYTNTHATPINVLICKKMHEQQNWRNKK